MKALIQRVSEASVIVNGSRVAEIGSGILLFVGIEKGDSLRDIEYLVTKVERLRIFEDDHGKMNRSVKDIAGSVLVVSQFTLTSDCRKGSRPSFDTAEEPGRARELYDAFVRMMGKSGLQVTTGQFGAYMKVDLVNDGPVTFLIDSRRASSTGTGQRLPEETTATHP
jgi:D-aminoacyl-tRNA deacylase